MGAGQSTLSAEPSPGFPASDNGHPRASAASASKDDGAAVPASPADPPSPGGEDGGCPMKNGDGSYRTMPGFESLIGRRMLGTLRGHPPIEPPSSAAAGGRSAASTAQGTAGAPEAGGPAQLPRDGGASWSYWRPWSWRAFRRGSDRPARETAGDGPPRRDDAYARPLPVDPANHMPLAADALPAPGQAAPLSAERVASTIPKGAGGTGAAAARWTYPSPQMFYNALARKGKLDAETREEDMLSVVAIHNAMNEGTWERILQWERVLCPPTDGEGGGGPSLTKFMGRPTDLSPKAFFKHYFLDHPLPFDRHDWTVTRTDPADGSTRDVRYVIDYFHDDAAAAEEEGSGLPALDAGIGATGRLQSLLVDVRPAADGVGALWGRLVEMPLARRGCRSVLECLLFKGHGSGHKNEFEPLPLAPSAGLKESLGESREVWEHIQADAATKKAGAGDEGAGEACASDASEGASTRAGDVTHAAERGRAAIDEVADGEAAEEPSTTRAEAKRLAASFSDILSQCGEAKRALQACNSDEECNQAFTGMTVCAGQFMCPLQHKSLMESLTSHDSATNVEMAEAEISRALEVLGECVANSDTRARAAKRQFPEVFEEVLGK